MIQLKDGAAVETCHIAGLTEQQRDLLGRLCLGEDFNLPRAPLEAMARAGYLNAEEGPIPGTGRQGRAVRYTVPISVHFAWCRWSAEEE